MNRTPLRLWSTARTVGVAATLALLAGLVLRPEPSLTILWKILIPLVPASLLVAPLVWRNTCPLATLHMAGSRIRSGGPPPEAWSKATPVLGIVLLAVLVPARRFAFNGDGPLLAAVILAIAIAAIALGAAFTRKAGFCNAMCPVLPVERLYGQRPWIELGQSRCFPCNGCTNGCLDLEPRRSVAVALDERSIGRRWLTTPFGAFAAAFPGFVVGYFLTVDGGWSTAPVVYGTVALGALASYAIVAVLTTTVGLPRRRVVPTLAALAAGVYYAFSAVPLATAIGLPAAAGEVLRAGFLLLVAAWLWRTHASLGRAPAG